MKRIIILLAGILIMGIAGAGLASAAVPSGTVQAATGAQINVQTNQALANPGSVLAGKQFTIHVPLELKNIPAEIAPYVQVRVVVVPQGSNWYSSPLGETFVPVPLVNGNFTGTVTARIDVKSGERPENAKVYGAHLVVMGWQGSNSGIELVEVMGTGSPYPAQAGAQFKVIGDLPAAGQ